MCDIVFISTSTEFDVVFLEIPQLMLITGEVTDNLNPHSTSFKDEDESFATV